MKAGRKVVDPEKQRGSALPGKVQLSFINAPMQNYIAKIVCKKLHCLYEVYFAQNPASDYFTRQQCIASNLHARRLIGSKQVNHYNI